MTYLLVFVAGVIVGRLALLTEVQRNENEKLQQIRRIKKKLEMSGHKCNARVYVKDNQLHVDMREEGTEK